LLLELRCQPTGTKLNDCSAGWRTFQVVLNRGSLHHPQLGDAGGMGGGVYVQPSA
jgi:hypothetical protein